MECGTKLTTLVDTCILSLGKTLALDRVLITYNTVILDGGSEILKNRGGGGGNRNLRPSTALDSAWFTLKVI